MPSSVPSVSSVLMLLPSTEGGDRYFVRGVWLGEHASLHASPSNMIRRLRTAASAALFLPPLLVGACGEESTGPRSERDGPLLAIAGKGELWLLNRGDEPVFTFVFDQDALAMANWAPCTDAARCPPLQPGAQRAVKFGSEGGIRAGHAAVVNWWYALPGPEGAVAGPIHSFVVRL